MDATRNEGKPYINAGEVFQNVVCPVRELCWRFVWTRRQVLELSELPFYCFECGGIHPTVVKLWLN